MSRWQCAACGRTFGRSRQGHLCVPVRSFEDFLDAQPPALRPVFAAVADYMRGFPDAVVEPGEAWLMLKRKRKFAAMIARRKWVRMWFILPEPVDHPRIQSRERGTGPVAHNVQLASASDVDEVLRGWLAAAYEAHR